MSNEYDSIVKVIKKEKSNDMIDKYIGREVTMKIITAPWYYSASKDEIKLFLAGGITNCPNWQQEVIDKINNNDPRYKDLVVFNPRRQVFPIDNPNAAYEQITWEYKMIEQCDIFSMYFSAGESDQPICMYELGRNILRMQMKFPADWERRIIISVEDGYKRKQDVLIQTELATNNAIDISPLDHDIAIKKHIDEIKYAYHSLKVL